MSDAIEFIGPRSHAERRYRIPPDVHARLEHEAALAGLTTRSLLLRCVEDECARRLLHRKEEAASRDIYDEVERLRRRLRDDIMSEGVYYSIHTPADPEGGA